MLQIEPAMRIPTCPDAGAGPSLFDWYLSDNWRWHALILHQIGQSTVNFDLGKSKGNATNLPLMDTRIPTFVCPSMSGGSSNVFADLGPTNQPRFQFTNYRGIAGTNLDRRRSFEGVVNNGVLYRDSATRMRDIRDGASSTLMLAESVMGIWGDGHSASTRAADDDLNGLPDWGSDGNYPSSAPSTFDAWFHDPGRSRSFSAGSWHAETVTVALADGSVRSLSKTLAFPVLAAMCTRNGAERVQMP